MENFPLKRNAFVMECNAGHRSESTTNASVRSNHAQKVARERRLNECDQWELPYVCYMNLCVTERDSLSALIFLSYTIFSVTPLGRLEADD